MALLIDKAFLLDFRKISGNLTDGIVNPFIKDAQEFELRAFLKDDLYLYLIAHTADADYVDLLAGKTFEYPAASNKNHKFAGLKAALAYFTLSLIVSEGNYHITATGSFEKNNEFSTATSSAERQRISNNYRERALTILSDAKLFLDAGKAAGKYPLWRTSCSTSDRPGSEPSIGRAHRLKNYNRYPRSINGDLCE